MEFVSTCRITQVSCYHIKIDEKNHVGLRWRTFKEPGKLLLVFCSGLHYKLFIVYTCMFFVVL